MFSLQEEIRRAKSVCATHERRTDVRASRSLTVRNLRFEPSDMQSWRSIRHGARVSSVIPDFSLCEVLLGIGSALQEKGCRCPTFIHNPTRIQTAFFRPCLAVPALLPSALLKASSSRSLGPSCEASSEPPVRFAYKFSPPPLCLSIRPNLPLTCSSTSSTFLRSVLHHPTYPFRKHGRHSNSNSQPCLSLRSSFAAPLSTLMTSSRTILAPSQRFL